MDDTKKLIEKYKRELMELSAAAQKRKPERRTAESDVPVKTPKIIGYVDENNSAYDNFLAELGKTPGSEITSPQAPDLTVEIVEETSDDAVKTGSNSSSESGSDTAPLDPDFTVGTDSPDNMNEQNSVSEPQIVNEPDGSITEIIDETTSEPLFTPPRYVEVPSTEQVRAEITENSNPAENRPENNVSGITDNSATAPRPDVADTLTTTEEQAERLNDQPVSGTDPNEQLTGRSFEEAAPPPATDISMERGSRAEPIDYPETNYDSYAEFEKANTGRGSLIFRVYTGREAVAIEGAECVITKKINGGSHTVAELVTNSSGQTPVQVLPTPPKELSQQSENTIQPFALYDASVTKPGFVRIELKDIPVFDGVQSVQRVFMIVDS